MTDEALKPWMLRADWRDDSRALAVVDLSAWPADTPILPHPPVPVIAFGERRHPAAAQADVVVETIDAVSSLAVPIRKAPKAAAAATSLLRAIEGLSPDRGLMAESFAFAMLQAGDEHRAWLSDRDATVTAAAGRVLLARHDDVLSINIDRPAAGNAIDRQMRDALYDAFSLAGHDTSIRSVRLRATGRCFGIGADLAEFGTTRDPATAHAIRARTLPALALLPRASIYEVHIQGACVGASLELAAFAGRVTASSDAWFQLPELGMGILPGAGGCVSIPARIGRQRAALMMLSGRRIAAQTALDWGLIDAIVDDPPADDRGSDQIS